MEDNEISFLGEKDKWTRVSPNRFRNIDHGQNSLAVTMAGVPEETVNLEFVVRTASPVTPEDVGDKIISFSCKINSIGEATVIFKPNMDGIPLNPDITCLQ